MRRIRKSINLYNKYKTLGLKFPLSKHMAIYYLLLGFKIVVRDNKTKGYYICCNYEPIRKEFLQKLYGIKYRDINYNFPILTIRNIRSLLKEDYIAFVNNPIGITEDDLC